MLTKSYMNAFLTTRQMLVHCAIVAAYIVHTFDEAADGHTDSYFTRTLLQ